MDPVSSITREMRGGEANVPTSVHRPIRGRVRVRFDYRSDSRDFLRQAGPGTRPEWERPYWTVSRTAFASVVDLLLDEYGVVEVTSDGGIGNRCDTRCREATGDDCVCSCAGTQHGIAFLSERERVVGETTIVDTTIARWRRLLTRR